MPPSRGVLLSIAPVEGLVGHPDGCIPLDCGLGSAQGLSGSPGWLRGRFPGRRDHHSLRLLAYDHLVLGVLGGGGECGIGGGTVADRGLFVVEPQGRSQSRIAGWLGHRLGAAQGGRLHRQLLAGTRDGPGPLRGIQDIVIHGGLILGGVLLLGGSCLWNLLLVVIFYRFWILRHPVLVLIQLQSGWLPVAIKLLDGAHDVVVPRLLLQVPDVLQGHLVLAQGGDAVQQEAAARRAALPAELPGGDPQTGGLGAGTLGGRLQPVGLVEGTHGTGALQRETGIDGFARIVFDFHYERLFLTRLRGFF